jgi:hypothetical protein
LGIGINNVALTTGGRSRIGRDAAVPELLLVAVRVYRLQDLVAMADIEVAVS